MVGGSDAINSSGNEDAGCENRNLVKERRLRTKKGSCQRLPFPARTPFFASFVLGGGRELSKQTRCLGTRPALNMYFCLKSSERGGRGEGVGVCAWSPGRRLGTGDRFSGAGFGFTRRWGGLPELERRW